ncbi:MAG: efflux RND transporter permease subunit, partial [Hydrogenophaga sp.]|nr:efflux RND transporter permease subunit [Hydrogenophaga sp.]
DPMLSSIWHDPEIEKHGHHAAPVTLYDKTIGRVTGWFDRVQDDLTELYQGTLRWSLQHKLATLGLALAVFVSSLFMVPLLGTEFVPKADFSETSLSFHTPVGSSLQATEAKTKQVEAILREFPEVKYTLSTINTGNAQGTMYASVYVRLVDRKERSINADAMAAKLRERLRTVPGINVTHAGLLDPVGGNKQIEFSLQGDDLAELERLTAQVMERVRPIVGLVDLDASVKPDKPTVDVVMRREIASDAGLNGAAVASSLRTLVAGQTVGNWRAADGESYDVNVRLAPEQRARTSDLEQLPFVVGTAADGSARVVRLGQVAQVVESTGPNQINRRNLNREVAINANVFGRSAGDVSADIRQVLDTIAMPPGYRYEFGGSTKNMQESFGYAVSALALAIIFI